jgi:hypothetical protein
VFPVPASRAFAVSVPSAIVLLNEVLKLPSEATGTVLFVTECVGSPLDVSVTATLVPASALPVTLIGVEVGVEAVKGLGVMTGALGFAVASSTKLKLPLVGPAGAATKL